jgi:hypothetical protein
MSMRTAMKGHLGLLALALSACTIEDAEPDTAPYNLEIAGTDVAYGRDLHVGLVDTTAGDTHIRHEWFPFERTVEYGDLLEPDRVYSLYLYYDRNDNGICDAPADFA